MCELDAWTKNSSQTTKENYFSWSEGQGFAKKMF